MVLNNIYFRFTSLIINCKPSSETSVLGFFMCVGKITLKKLHFYLYYYCIYENNSYICIYKNGKTYRYEKRNIKK